MMSQDDTEHKKTDAPEEMQNAESVQDAAQKQNPETEIEGLKAKLAEAEDKLLRATAEFDNTRKRIQRRSDELVKFSNESLLSSLLPLMDDFDRAMASMDSGHDAKAVQKDYIWCKRHFIIF